MALQTEGQITLEDIAVELGRPGTQISLLDSDVLALIGKSASDQVSLTDFYGAASFSPFTAFDTSTAPSSVPTSMTHVTINNGTAQGTGATVYKSFGLNLADNLIVVNGWLSGGSQWVYASGWNHALNWDLSDVPTSARSGKIKITFGQSYEGGANYTPADNYFGNREYVRSNGSTVYLFGPTNASSVTEAGLSLPNYYTYGRIDASDDFDYGYFITQDTVQDYLDASRDFQFRMRHNGGSLAGQRWHEFNGTVDQETRFTKIEVVDPSTTSGNFPAGTIA